MEKVIECKNITHYYGEKLIYENLNFEVEKGKVLGLLGKNGTGKTTIINILNGYLKPRSGECYLLGENMNHLTPATKPKSAYYWKVTCNTPISRSSKSKSITGPFSRTGNETHSTV